jgi:PPOX class probable F420-dependent enzyme
VTVTERPEGDPTRSRPTLPDDARAVVDAANYAVVATLTPSGAPQTSVVWIGRDGDDLLFSTIRGRFKTRNMERDPRISITVIDGADPYRYLEVRGEVTLTDEGGRELMDAFSRKYRGQDTYVGDRPDAVRVVCRLRPRSVFWRAPRG